MEFFPNSRTFVSFGSLSIQWYAVLIITGAFLAFIISLKNTRRMKYPDDYIEDIFIYVLWAGIIGARLWFCAFYDFSYYITHPLEIIAIWDGGLAIQGGLVGAIIVAYFYTKRHGLSFLRMADAILPNVLLAQAIGRWGNFVNKEAHGAIVDGSYFDGILSFLKDGMYINGSYYEPMFFYESVLCIIGFVIIVFILKRFQNKRGDLMWAYFMWYGVIRFFIEGHRTDSLMLGPLRMAQVTSIIFILIGVLGYVGAFEKFFKKPKPTVIFDLDGTLLDTQNGIEKTYEMLFEKYSSKDKFTEEVKTEVLGPALEDMFKKYFPNEDVDKLLEEYRIYNDEIFLEVNKMMPNAKEVLKTLKEEGHNIAIVSTKKHDTVESNLKVYDLLEYIDDIVGCDDVKKQKPDPEGINKVLHDGRFARDEVIYVGDSVMDIMAGKNAGSYTVGYYFNPNKKEALDNAKANEYISDLKDVLTIVKKKIHFTSDMS